MISAELSALICQQLGLDSYPLAEETKAWEVPGWDSLSHLGIIVAVEKHFGIKLRGLEVMRLKSVGDLQALVDRKIRRE